MAISMCRSGTLSQAHLEGRCRVRGKCSSQALQAWSIFNSLAGMEELSRKAHFGLHPCKGLPEACASSRYLA